MFENLGDGKFREDKDTGMNGLHAHRGLAVGDLDGDGDLDVAVVSSNEACEVYENVTAGGKYLQVDFAAPRGNRFAIGARVEVEAGGKRQIRDVRTGLLLPVAECPVRSLRPGQEHTVDRLTVRRPGNVQVFENLPANKRLVIE